MLSEYLCSLFNVIYTYKVDLCYRLNYGQVSILLNQRVRVSGLAELKVDQEKDFYIFYLVTKVLYHQKPTLLDTTLVQLKERIKELIP